MGTPARVTMWLTGTAVVLLAAGFTLLGPAAGNYPAQVVGALAAVAAIGVTMWAALRGGGSTRRVSRTGDAYAVGRGSRAVSGSAGRGAGRSVRRTGVARAEAGGHAVTGDDSR